MMEKENKNTMLGAIIGDIVGSVYEWHNIKTKDFPFFSKKGRPTDDSYMTIALADAILVWDAEGRKDYGRLSELAEEKMREYGHRYPHGGYGGNFRKWLIFPEMGPYNSCGNGSAMRVSPVGFAAKSLEECIAMSKAVTEVTHNHPDGIMGAEATSVQIYLLRQGKTLGEIRSYETEHYYPVDFSIPVIRPTYSWGSLCSNTCPMAFASVYEAVNYEDAIRNAISIGGDSDTLGAIAGGIAAAAFGIPSKIRKAAAAYLDEECLEIIRRFEKRFL